MAILAAPTTDACAQSEPQAVETALSRRLGAMARTAPLVVAHRGASAQYPENTMVAFQAALDSGAQMVELDFRQTADGQLVVLHDRTLDRTTNSAEALGQRDVAVAATPWNAVQKLDAGSWKDSAFAGTKVPSLEQALTLIQKGAVTMIEHKAGNPAPLVALLRRLELVDDVLVQSFDWDWLAAVHALEPRLTIGALGEKAVPEDLLARLAPTGASVVHWDHARLRLEDVETLHRHGYLVCVYTINADVGLIGAGPLDLDMVATDRPGRMHALVERGAVPRRPR